MPPAAAHTGSARDALARKLSRRLQSDWWQPAPTLLCQVLRPASWLVAGAAAVHRALFRWGWRRVQAAPVPVIVVGNLIVGGAGKTPTTIALVQALQAAGRYPGIVSRGYGRQGQGNRAVGPDSSADEVGDEPLLMQRRTGVPVWVGRARVQAARALCAAHPQVDVLVCDDGLQHHALARDLALWVFDDRGTGNGLRLPAGPLRDALPHRLPPDALLLYTGQHLSTPLPGALATRRAGHALPLADWWAGDDRRRVPLAALRDRPLLALAGLASPEKFFAPLRAAGLHVQTLPQPDHARYDSLPWLPLGQDVEVITTEKDAVKLPVHHVGRATVWVVPLDLELSAELLQQVLHRLPPSPWPAPVPAQAAEAPDDAHTLRHEP